MTPTIDKIAWIHLADGKILSTRSRGKNVYYIPGGKRETGESDLDTLAASCGAPPAAPQSIRVSWICRTATA